MWFADHTGKKVFDRYAICGFGTGVVVVVVRMALFCVDIRVGIAGSSIVFADAIAIAVVLHMRMCVSRWTFPAIAVDHNIEYLS